MTPASAASSPPLDTLWEEIEAQEELRWSTNRFRLTCRESLTQDASTTTWLDETQRHLLLDEQLVVLFTVEISYHTDDNNHTDNDKKPPQVFHFGCHRPSFGCLEAEETGLDDTFQDEVVDPNFFNVGYTLAGSTGFSVWAGARVLLQALLCPEEEESPTNHRLSYYRQWIHPPREEPGRILELGAGVGVLGTVLASVVGAQVLLTDLPTLVDHALATNLQVNHETTDHSTKTTAPPTWFPSTTTAYTLGSGWAATTALDWTRPVVPDQLTMAQVQAVDLMVASDCIFLQELVTPFFQTVATVFRHMTRPALLLTFPQRHKNVGSATFTTLAHIWQEVVVERQWSCHCVTWQSVTLVDGTVTQVLVLEIRP